MNRDALRSALDGNPWFAGLPPALADGILTLGRLRKYDDRMIYAAGDPPNGMFALISGEIRFTQTTSEGRTALLMIGRPGTWFGESSMLDGGNRYSDAAAIGKTTVLQLTPAAFAELTRDNTAHYRAFVQIVCERHRKTVDHLVNSASLPLPVRLAQRLLELGRTHGRREGAAIVVGLRLSQEELAGTLGVSRQTINKALKSFERDGLVAVGYASTTLRRHAALEKLASAHVPLPAPIG